MVAKGGITSHDVAVRGLGMRRAEVLGQLLPGMVSVFRPVEAAPEAVGIPYVVFAGNVGDEKTLANVIDLFSRHQAKDENRMMKSDGSAWVRWGAHGAQRGSGRATRSPRTTSILPRARARRRRREAADSVAEAAADADVLVVMVATPAQVEEVLFGDGDGAAALRPGAVVLVMATVGAAAVPAGPNGSPSRAWRWSTRRCPAVSRARAAATC